MSAARLDFTEQSEAGPAEQGSRFVFDITYADDNGDPLSIAGYTIRMQVRETWTETTALLDLSTATDGITITDGAGGAFTIDVPATTMATKAAGMWVYDLELVPSGDEDAAFKLFRGDFQIVPEATR